MSRRITFRFVELEAKYRGIEFTRDRGNGYKYTAEECGVPGAGSESYETLEEAWSYIYNWDNAKSREIRERDKFDALKPRLIKYAKEVYEGAASIGEDIYIEDTVKTFNEITKQPDAEGYWVPAFVYVRLSDLEEQEEKTGDDLCDKCMRSNVEVSRTEGGKTICVDCDDSSK